VKKIIIYTFFGILFLALSHFVRLTTVVSLSLTPTSIVWKVEDSALEKVLSAGKITEISVSAHQSFFDQGIEYFRVTDSTGRVSELPFEGSYKFSSLSTRLSGDWYTEAPAEEELYSQKVSWTPPLKIEAKFYGRGLQATAILLKGDHSVLAQFRRGIINNDYFLDYDQISLGGGATETNSKSSAMGLMEPFVTGLGYCCFLIALTLVLSSLTSRSSFALKMPGLPPSFVYAPVFILISLGLSVIVAFYVLEGLPHFQDDLCYLLRAKWLTAGHLFEVKPPYSDYLQLDHTYFTDTKWLTIYPIGWPLLLQFGEQLGQPALVAPICAAIGMLVLLLLANKYGRAVSISSASLALLSPIVLILSGSMLSHAATGMCLILSTYLLLSSSGPALFFSGLALGYSFGIRPLTALSFSACFAIYLLVELFFPDKARSKPLRLKHLFLFGLGALIGLLPLLYDNFSATGDPLVFAYSIGKGHHLALSNLHLGLEFGDVSMALVQPLSFGWFWGLIPGPFMAPFTYAFLLVVFATGKAKRLDWLLLAIFLSLPIFYFLHDTPGMHGYGPRFYFESLFALFILTARGFAVLVDLAAQKARAHSEEKNLAQIILIACLVLLTLSPVPFLKGRIANYKGYNMVDSHLEEQFESQGLREGVILLKTFYDFAMLSKYLPPDLMNAKLKFLLNSADKKNELKQYFQGSKIYELESSRFIQIAP